MYPIQFRIGIASGMVMAGYAGKQHRVTYTCVGDPVRLAACSESHTKIVERLILIAAETRPSLFQPLQVDAPGEMMFRGKTLPVQVVSIRTTV